MAYPIKLFDFQTEEGRKNGVAFLQSLDKNLTELFGTVPKTETQRQFHKWDVNQVPSYLTDLAIKSVKDVLKKLPEGEMKWKGSVGLYGRKTGSAIKREGNILYRIIINLGDIEVYSLEGDGFSGEPVALPNGYALLCSPVMIDRIDIKVQKDPIRKNLNSKLVGLVPKIRSKNYLRSTIVLDLLMDGLTISDVKDASVPSEQLEQNEQVENVEQGKESEQVENIEQNEQVEQSEKVENIEQNEQVEQSEQVENVEQVKESEQLENIEQPKEPEQSEQSGQLDQSEQPKEPEQSE